MVNLSVDQALFKAKSHAQQGKIQEAQKLYEVVLQAFPKNKIAQHQSINFTDMSMVLFVSHVRPPRLC